MRRPLALLIVARVAAAQPADLTKEFQAGVDAFRLGKLDEAREHLEKARDMDPTLPGPYRFLGAVGQAQHRWPECIDNARKALELNPRSAEVMDTRKLIEACRVSAGRPGYRAELGDSAAVAVTTNVSGATVKINGLTYGGTPIAPRPITSGALEVEIEKAGWKPVTTNVNALPGIVTDVIIDLEPDPNFKGITDVAAGTGAFKIGYLVVPGAHRDFSVDGAVTPPKDRIELSPGTHVVEVREPGKDPWRRRVRISGGQKTTITPAFVDTEAREADEHLGLYIIAGGGALLAGGFITAMVSRDAANEARDIDRIERARDPSRPLAETAAITPVRTRDDLQHARDRAARFSAVSSAAYVTGLITSGVGAYFLYKGARQRSDAPPPFAVAPVAGGGAVVSKEVTW